VEERRRIDDKNWDITNAHMATTNEHLKNIDAILLALSSKIQTQNGRIGKLETAQYFQKGALWVLGGGFTVITTILMVMKR
jgi:hypothetical protein